jgi:hypothetical protein
MADRDPADRRPTAIGTQDEGRFGRINTPRRCWAPPKCRPVAPRQVVREYLYAYAAVCPKLGRMTALLLPYANTAMMALFLAHVSKAFAAYFMVLLVDRAAWHMSRQLEVPENIRLLPLPAHSPELNPTELVWREWREKDLPNRAFTALEEVEEALCIGLNRLAANPDGLRSLTNYTYIDIPL